MKNRVLTVAVASFLALSFASPVAAAEMKAKKEPTAAQMAARERMTKCSAEWKETKAAGKMESGMKWPKFWSACNARMKGNKA
jgi:Ni/Co efflux regulator RcnB